MSLILNHLLIGTPQPLGTGPLPSSIASRRPVSNPVRLTREGLEGDQVGNKKVHGGPEKAVHLYPSDHYAAWAADLPDMTANLTAPGAFGENLAVSGVTEADVCIGDIIAIGSARLQLSQPRQPCATLGRRFGLPILPKRVQQTGRTGWYYRVLEEGDIRSGNEITLLERPNPDWPLARLLRVLYHDMLDRDALTALSTLPGLSPGMQRLAGNRLANGAVEDWAPRLGA